METSTDIYRFYVENADGNETEWRGLTLREAKAMYKYTATHQPSNVKSYGWEVIRRSPLPEPLTQNS